MGKINLQALPFSISFSLYFLGNLTPKFNVLFPIFDGERDSQAKVRWYWYRHRCNRHCLNLYLYYFHCDRAPLEDVLRIIRYLEFFKWFIFHCLKGRTHLCRIDIRQEWYWVTHNDTTGGICMEGGLLGATATSMQYAKMACGENFERWGWFGNMICYERYRRTESEIRCTMGICKLVVRYMSSI